MAFDKQAVLRMNWVYAPEVEIHKVMWMRTPGTCADTLIHKLLHSIVQVQEFKGTK